MAQVQRLLTTPEMIARTWTATKGELDEREVLGLLTDFGSLWTELFPAEQARIVRLLVERVDVQVEVWRCGCGPRGWPASWPSCGISPRRRRRPEPCTRRAGPTAAHWWCASRCGSVTAARPQAHPGAGRQRADAADQAAAGRRAGQGAGPGVAVAEAAGPGRLQLGHRDRRGGEDLKSYVSRILRLALLAPDIVEAILGGWADQRAMLERLERPLAVEWEEQRHRFIVRQATAAASP